MHPPIPHRHDQLDHDEHGPAETAELLALADAVGVTRAAGTAAVGACHRPGQGRQRPGWLLGLRPARRPGCWHPFVRVLGVLLGAAGATVTGFVVAFGLAVPATGAALLSLLVALAAAVVLR